MASEALLTAEELAFIHELECDPSQLSRSDASVIELGGDAHANSLLARLGLANELKLVTLFRQHELVFPVDVVMDETQSFRLELHSPEIFELGVRLRNWRLKLATPLPVRSRLDRRPLALAEISSTGFCIDGRDDDAPEFLELDFRLPESQELLQLSGIKVRRTQSGCTAYSMALAPEPREPLRRFLYQCHKQNYEDLSGQSPVA
ncbi:hypothetical protein [Pseudaeromonas paramecii]|uniref:PilZ domain-containing protein n=1 Tax=Pseudaeromonas paramecii TaxID=2138166 RepID=A0ABP8PVF9_9GAMM